MVTGSSRGIGRGIARCLAGAGWDVAVNYAGNREAAGETGRLCREEAQRSGRPIRTVEVGADVGRAGDRERLVEETLAALGRIDLLVNNAGITSPGRADILEAGEEGFDRLMAVNLKGPFFLTQRVARWMIGERERDPSTSFTIVNISSVSEYAVSVDRGDYCLSKAALGMMTRLWAARLAPHGIAVHGIRPGIVRSDMTAPVREKYEKRIAAGLAPIARWGEPEDVGRAVLALAGGAFGYSTGETINVDGGFHIRRI